MGQLYLQRFEYRGAISQAEFEGVWGGALEAFAKAGNWGGVPAGVTHVRTYGTGWGGYALIEVDDPEAFARYQAHHNQRYGRIATITWEPLFDMDAAFEPAVRGLKATT
jgi:hypothetical protein